MPASCFCFVSFIVPSFDGQVSFYRCETEAQVGYVSTQGLGLELRAPDSLPGLQPESSLWGLLLSPGEPLHSTLLLLPLTEGSTTLLGLVNAALGMSILCT